MDFEKVINPKSLFHAYCIQGQREELYDSLLNFIKNSLSFEVKNNPDFWAQSFETFGIDDAKLLKSMSLYRSFSPGRKIFIISTDFITGQAENALLKIFEEPQRDVHFFILISSADSISPVLRSRLLTLKANKKSEDDFSGRFLKLSIAERLKLCEKFFLDKGKSEVLSFLTNLETSLRKQVDIKKAGYETLFAFNEIKKCINYMYGPSPKIKSILDYVALIVPLTK